MKTTKEMIEVMQAYDRGEQIEVKDLNDADGWMDAKEPLWDWHYLDYRVKPKKKYVPFDKAEEFLEAQREHGSFIIYKNGGEELQTFVNSKNAVVSLNQVFSYKAIMKFEELFRDYTFSDLTPCGKEV